MWCDRRGMAVPDDGGASVVSVLVGGVGGRRAGVEGDVEMTMEPVGQAGRKGRARATWME